jgi:hypothetical protein
METFTFRRGDAWFESDSPTPPWAVVFEDEGDTGYLYAYDLTSGSDVRPILDAMMIYNNVALKADEPEHHAEICWSADGQQVVLYVDGTAQALIDFDRRIGCCRTDYPNFPDSPDSDWRKSSHAWDDAALQRFETGMRG